MTLEDIRGLWRGRTVACIASGPSLTAEDCERVRGLPTVVVNTSFRLAPWADMLFAMDAAWWEHYHGELDGVFSGQRWGYVRVPKQYGVSSTKEVIYPKGWGNSGSYAISLAVVAKPMRILLLGYDSENSMDGRKHWHPDHPGKMGNAASIKRWPYQFELVAKYAQSHGIAVVNCSRSTSLSCFERMTLEEALDRV